MISRRFKVDDRVIAYHISGCGVCLDCREGTRQRRSLRYLTDNVQRLHDQLYVSYEGSLWLAARRYSVRGHVDQLKFTRIGGHAEYMLAEENTLIPLPEPLSYVDGALIACGFGTAYEALCRAHVLLWLTAYQLSSLLISFLRCQDETSSWLPVWDQWG